MVLHLESGRKLPKHLRHEEIPRHIFTPRTYQVQLLDFALHQNSIVCVSNEESKAFLVVSLVKEIIPDLSRGERRRHIVLLVNEEKYGQEMGNVILQHIDTTVRFHDDISTVNTTGEHQDVLIFTGDLFLEVIKSGLIRLSDVNLVIFDECHSSNIENHPYLEIMQIYSNLSAEKPKILALTTSFLTDKLQTNEELDEKIGNLERTFLATAETANLVMGDRYGSPPEQKITICPRTQSEASVKLNGDIEEVLCAALLFLDDCVIREADTSEELDVCNVPKRALIVCWDILGELGSWCAAASARALIKQLEKIISHEKTDIGKTLLRFAATQLHLVSEMFERAFYDVYSVEGLEDFVSPKVVELLHILRRYKPEEDFMVISEDDDSMGDLSDSDISDDMSDMSDGNKRQKFIHVAVKNSDASSQEDLFESENSKKLCALIFVDKKNAAQFLFKLIDEICAWDENLFFVKSRYIVGSKSKPNTKEVVKKEEEILKNFRMQDLNLLVCTNVLEEGVDIPRCNLVVKFNPPASYRSYTLSKSRARATKSQYIMLVDESEKDMFEVNLAEYMSIQQVLKARCHNPDLTCEQISDDTDNDILPPYVPSTNDTAQVTMHTAIAHINRYCAKLPSDSFTHLTPICHVTESCDEEGVAQFTAYLRLPINSTVKDEIVGEPMPTRHTAQKAVALKACEILHKEGELDDNLLPVGKEVFRYEDEEEVDEEDSEGQARAGTAKRKRYYFKQVPQILMASHPTANTPCVLYDLNYRLTGPITDEQNSRGRQIYAPEDSLRGFGILMAHSIPQVPKFPIYTRSGEVTISVDKIDPALSLTEDELDMLHKFHKFTFSNVLRLQKDPMDYNPYETDVSYIVVPVNKDSPEGHPSIDWDFIKKVESSVSQTGKNKHIHDSDTEFKFDTELFKDAVVMPSYRNVDQPQYFYVAEIRYDLSPISPFPSPDLYKTFEKYYETKYGLKITHSDQPLLDVDHTSARLNLLTPRYMNQKGMVLPTCSSDTKRARRENLQQKQILIPELCDIHVFPASLWRKAVCLPAILYRSSSLLITEEMRVKVAHETKIGCEVLAEDFIFPPLDFGFETSPEKLTSPGLQINSENGSMFSSDDSNVNSGDQSCMNSVDNSHANSGENSHVNNSENSLGVNSYEDMNSHADHSIKSNDSNIITNDSNAITNDSNVISNDSNVNNSDTNVSSHVSNISHDSGVICNDSSMSKDSNDSPDSNVDTSEHSNMKSNKESEMTDFIESSEVDTKAPNETSIQATNEAPNEAPNEAAANDNCDNSLHTAATTTSALSLISHQLNQNNCDTVGNTLPTTADTFHDGSLTDLENVKNVENKLKSLCINGAITGHAHILLNQSSNDSVNTSDASKCTGDSLTESSNDSVTVSNSCNLNQSGAEETEIESQNSEEESVNSKTLTNYATEDGKDTETESEIAQTGGDTSNDVTPKSQESHLSIKHANAPKSYAIPHKPLVIFDENVNLNDYVGPSPCTILQAITMSNANDFFSLERLETIGDSFLKYAITVYLYCTYPGIHEGKLSYLRSKQVSNYNLYRLGKRKGFPEYVISSKFEPSENWLPPGYCINENQRKGSVPKVTISATTESAVKYLESLAESNKSTDQAPPTPPPVVTKEPKETKSKGSKSKSAPKSFDFDGVKPLNDFSITQWMGAEAETNNFLSGSSISHSTEQYQQFRREFEDLAWNNEEGRASVAYSLRTQHCVPDKSVADCVESLLGCYLISGGNHVALLFMSWLGLKVLPRINGTSETNAQIADQFSELKLPPSPLSRHSATDNQILDHLTSGLEAFEQTIGYKFNDTSYLLQAFTHASYYHNVVTDCYQRLEFLGDAILDYVITRHLYEDSRKYSPGVLTDLRSALVNNNIFAALAVKWNFHKYFKTFSPALYHVINKFVTWQKENEDCINIDEDFSEEDQNAPEMEIPKALGDIFESVAGAIYLDSGMSLDTVWTVYYKIMSPLIR